MRETPIQPDSEPQLYRWFREFWGDTRASSFSIGYVITLGITAIFLVGVTVGVASVIDSQDNIGAQHQSDTMSAHVAGAVEAVDRAGTPTQRTVANLTLEHDLPGPPTTRPAQVWLLESPTNTTNKSGVVLVSVSAGEQTSVRPVDTASTIAGSVVSGKRGVIDISHSVASTDDRTRTTSLSTHPTTARERAAADTDGGMSVTVTDGVSPTPIPVNGTARARVEVTVSNTAANSDEQAISIGVWEDHNRTVVEVPSGESRTVTLDTEVLTSRHTVSLAGQAQEYVPIFVAAETDTDAILVEAADDGDGDGGSSS